MASARSSSGWGRRSSAPRLWLNRLRSDRAVESQKERRPELSCSNRSEANRQSRAPGIRALVGRRTRSIAAPSASFRHRCSASARVADRGRPAPALGAHGLLIDEPLIADMGRRASRPPPVHLAAPLHRPRSAPSPSRPSAKRKAPRPSGRSPRGAGRSRLVRGRGDHWRRAPVSPGRYCPGCGVSTAQGGAHQP